MGKYIMSLDQGTTSCRAILFDHSKNIVCASQREFKQYYPKPGWVEHDPVEIWECQLAVARDVLSKCGVSPHDIHAIGITNQRETTVVWDKSTGKPVHNAIVWQCRRTSGICEQLKARGLTDTIKNKTGLIPDAYFSGTKIKWILDENPGLNKESLLFGTMDTWLAWNLTGGNLHITDYSNASRTMLYNIRALCWDNELLDILDIPRSMLPEVVSNSQIYGYTDKDLFGSEIPISGMAGDQQAALFGHRCIQPGSAKNTYGTGCFLLMNTGGSIVQSQNGLLSTIAWGLDGKVQYALEGSIFMGGATVQWLRDGLRVLDSAAQSEEYAQSVSGTNGVYLVPAFTGLGAPHWDMYARGVIIGLTRDTRREHIIRAGLEAIAYQTKEVLDIMHTESLCSLSELHVDGGASANGFLMQFQSDILGVNVCRPKCLESTALGAALFAGLSTRFWESIDELSSIDDCDAFSPDMPDEEKTRLFAGWKKAVGRSRAWEEH